tara:strand:- start:5906 stop:6292 length:387 start_codon:yes stop_codon:yes gene_type:complete
MKKQNKPKHTKPFEWEKGSYKAGEILNNEWVYYDYYGENDDPNKNRFEDNEEKFSWKMTEDKLNYYQSLIYFPKHISIIDNKTSRTDTELKRYVCNVILKEENADTRERNNKKAREKRQKIKEKRLAI